MIFVDKTLTPENAPERGYELIRDIIYDIEEPEESRKPKEDLILREGFLLGQPATRTAAYICTGLYAPILTKQKRKP